MTYRTDKLVIDGHTDTHTHIHTQATTIPEGQNWPRVKMKSHICHWIYDSIANIDGLMQKWRYSSALALE